MYLVIIAEHSSDAVRIHSEKPQLSAVPVQHHSLLHKNPTKKLRYLRQTGHHLTHHPQHITDAGGYRDLR
jgi:hypothetical protein